MLGTRYPVYQEQFQETDKCDRLSVFDKIEIHFQKLTGFSMYFISIIACYVDRAYSI